MTSPPYRPLQQETFIVRLWREAGSMVWRGEIIHLPDRAARRFTSLEHAVAFIAAYAPGISAEAPPADDDAPFQ
ncbi:MAG: hypothetical protein RMK84_09340 [Oscillochloridaceae bacterium]|nr:hypothetical protein [Chloroflexaceae bacterium]MCX7789889.1 hypothetical protein [Chloroflexaceae bacterium]MDW8390317.1 hypothetical protein [Oscillochloridaceae bacterium]